MSETQPPVSRTRGGTFEIQQCLSEAWSNCWAGFPLWFGALWVYFMAVLLSVVSIVGILFVLPVLVWGATRFGLRLHDGAARFGDLWAGFNCYRQALGQILGLALLLGFIGFLAQLPQMLGEWFEISLLAALGMLVSLAFSLFVTPRLNLAYLFAVDQGLKATEALNCAWEETQGVAWRCAGMALVSLAIVLAGLLLFVIGVFPALVMTWLMWVSAYRQLTKSTRSEQSGVFPPMVGN
ncbi:hypothetical protein MK489_14760 [Myxococcota bacterium]|nr:hypothetical protein [Myxococcota bacterium]